MSPFALAIAVPLLFALCAAGFAFNSSQQPLGARKAQLKYTAGLLFAGAFGLYGIVNTTFIHSEPRISVTGTLNSLSQTHGKSASSSFWILPAEGTPLHLHTDYSGSNLADGEQLTATYVQGYGTVTYLRLQDGEHAGWELHEGDGTLRSVLCIGLAVFLALSAKKALQLRPDGSPAPDRRKSSSGVDENSLSRLDR